MSLPDWHQMNTPIFNRKYIFKWSIFHCHVSFPEGSNLTKDVKYYSSHTHGSVENENVSPSWQFSTEPWFWEGRYSLENSHVR